MKYLYLLLRKQMRWASLIALVLGNVALQAQQRYCDVALVCDQPSGMVVNGGALALRFEMWNRGPDIQFSHDTTIYKLYRVTEGDTVVVYQGLIRGRDGDTIPVGKGSRYEDNYVINFRYPERKDTIIVDFCVAISSWGVYQNGDTLRLSYADTNRSNNQCCQQVKVYPKTSIAIEDHAHDDANWGLYPNPAKDKVYLRIGADLHSKDMQVSIQDWTGRTLLRRSITAHLSAEGTIPVDIAQLPAGLYQLQLHTDKGVRMTKLSVYK